MIVFTLRLAAPPDKRGEIVQTLRSLVGPTQAERGCASCRIQHDEEDDNVLTFVEEWETQEDLDRHMCSDEYRRLLVVMDMSAAPPEVTFRTVSDVAGLERIEAAMRKRTGFGPQ